MARPEPEPSGGRSSPDHLLLEALAAAPVGVALLDRDLRYLFANRALAVANRRPGEAHLGRTIGEVLRPEASAVVAPVLQACFATGRPSQDVELEVPDARGNDQTWRVSAYPVEIDGSVEAVAALIMDVTEAKRAEAVRAQLEEDLHQVQKLEAVGEFAAGVAHDLNNLLMVISSASELGLAHADERSEGLFAEIKAASERAGTTTRGLLAFARRQELRREPLDLNALVADAAELLRLLVGNDVRLEIELAPRLPAVIADATEIQRILLNLASNARDAMPMGGTLRIATAPSELDGAAAVALDVSDDGVGIDASTRDRIFDPFFTTKPLGKGTGLGLAAARGTVEQLEGTIAVDSAPGEGTTFEIRLPATAESALPPESERSEAEARGHEVVLLVDDNAPLRMLAGDYLMSLEYRVLLAASAEEAEAMFAREEPDVVVTDLEMPRVDGRVLAQHLRAEEPELPVLYVSGYHLEETDGVGENEAFMQKPFDLPDLACAIRALLDRRPAHSRRAPT